MKLRLKDKVLVTAGRDKGKTGEVLAILPKANQVVVEGVNVVKRHQKPTTQNPRGGIVELTKPLDASKVQVLDPKTGKPARVSYKRAADGSKERVFTVAKFSNKAKKLKAEKTAKATKPQKKQEAKA